MEIYFIARPSIQSTFLSVPCVLEKEICVLMLLGEMFYKCRVGQTDYYCSSLVYTDFLSTCSIS